jgi:hypothetical protein
VNLFLLLSIWIWLREQSRMRKKIVAIGYRYPQCRRVQKGKLKKTGGGVFFSFGGGGSGPSGINEKL